MKNDADQKRRKLQTITVFVSVFIIVNTIVYIIDLKQIKEEKLQAGYTAETTINRIESQINQYLAEFHLVKHVIEDGGDLGKKEFALSVFMRMIYSCLVDADFLDTEKFMKNNHTGREAGEHMEKLLEN